MIKDFNIGKLNLTFVFRHRWEKEQRFLSNMFNTKELGLFWRKEMVVGRRKKGKAMFDSDNMVPSYMFGVNFNMVPSYMFGVNLIVCKFWFNIGFNSLNIKI